MCFRVSSCCGCGSLQDGCKRIAITFGVLSVLGLLSNFTLQGIVSTVLSVVVCGCLYYGAEKQKTAFLLVWLIVTGIELGMMIFLIVMLVVALTVGSSFVEELMEDQGQQPEHSLSQHETQQVMGIVLGVMLVTFIFVELLFGYFWSVVYSYFKEIQEQRYQPQDHNMAEKGYAVRS